MKRLFYILFLPLTMFAQQNIEICDNTPTFTYSTEMNGPGTIEWTVNNTVAGTGNDISLTFDEEGIYEITAVGYNDIGCASEPVNYTVVITSCDPLIYWVPNCFTPDGNEYNQVWGPIFTSGYSVDHFQLYVLNRWGNVVWESLDPAATWDGTYDGKTVPDGVYTWLIRFDLLNTDEKREIHGHVTVIR